MKIIRRLMVQLLHRFQKTMKQKASANEIVLLFQQIGDLSAS